MKCPPNSRGVPVQPKAKTQRKSEQPRIQTSHRDPSGTNERRSTHRSNFFEYANEPFSMSGYNSPQASKLSPSREVSSFPTKLVEGDTGPMGPNTILGYQIDSTSTCNTSLSTILCIAESSDSEVALATRNWSGQLQLPILSKKGAHKNIRINCIISN